MATTRVHLTVLPLLLVLGIFLGLAAAQTEDKPKPNSVVLPGTTEKPNVKNAALCAGPAAKVRYQWAYKLKANSKTNLDAVDKLTKEWMALCKPAKGGGVLRYGQGPTKATAADYGYKGGVVPSTVTLADYGAWSDFNSVDDIKACYEVGIKDGVVGKIRKYAQSSARVAYSLERVMGSPRAVGCKAGTTAPATIRFMTFYTLASTKKPVLKAIYDLMAIISSKTKGWIRTANGPDMVEDVESVYGKGVTRTADYGSFRDFESIPEMLKEFTDPAAIKETTAVRAYPRKSMRVAIALE